MKWWHGLGVAAVIAAGFATLAWVGQGTAPRPEAGPPHIVVVIGCTVRADEVTPWGGHPEATPFLAQLAERGTRFETTVAAGPWTRPAVTAITTGQHPTAIGLVEPSGKVNRRRLPDEVPTLAELLAEKGYATVGHTTNPNVGRPFGFDRGFERFGQTEGEMVDHATKVRGSRAVDTVLAEVDALGALERPLYLQVLLIDAHLPDKVDDAEVEPFANGSERQRRYRAMLRRFDDAVRRLASGLEERGFAADRTVYVVVADHGEGLGEPAHHGNAHGFFLYPSSVHVPWLMAGPGVPEGHLAEGLYSQLDVLPTVLSLTGEPQLPAPREQVYTDTWFRKARRAAMYDSDAMCQVDFDPGSVQERPDRPRFDEACFAWPEDPACTQPIASPSLEAALRRTHREMADEAGMAPEADVDSALRDQLRALGYEEE